jgi:type 1 glutamine amidotransferase
VQAGKPVVGIRTASHAFAPAKNKKVPEGHAAWPEFDAQVLGGNYHNHHGRQTKTFVRVAAGAEQHPLLAGIRPEEFMTASSLYKTSPLAKGTTLLLMGRADDLQPHEPVAWTFTRADGGRTFYTSLGHPQDFALPPFQRLLRNGIYWAAGVAAPPR